MPFYTYFFTNAVTMMNTVQYLWEKQDEQEDKISSAEIAIGRL